MNQKLYNFVSGAIFLFIAALHLLRIFNGWPAVIDTVNVSMWISVVAAILAGYLSYCGLSKK